MANNYKFTGVALATTAQTAIITAASGENIIIKSIIITNNTANTPTVTLDVVQSLHTKIITTPKKSSICTIIHY